MSALARSAGVLVLVLATASFAQTAQDHLKKAHTLVDKKQWAPALKLVEKAGAEAGNDLETTLELLELSGICNAALKKAAPAKTAFLRLLSLAPTFTINRKVPPQVTKAFGDAKASAGEPLTIGPATPDMNGGKIAEIAVDVRADPLKLAKTVIFNYRANGGKWKTRAVPTALGRVAAKVDAENKVEWYATVLGANDTELMRIRNVDAPIAHTYRAPTPAAAPVKELPPEPVAAAPTTDVPRKADPIERLTPEDRSDPIDIVDRGGGRKSWVTPVGVVLLAGAAGAAGVGIYFGSDSRNARILFGSGVGNGDPVVGLSRQDALALDALHRHPHRSGGQHHQVPDLELFHNVTCSIPARTPARAKRPSDAPRLAAAMWIGRPGVRRALRASQCVLPAIRSGTLNLNSLPRPNSRRNDRLPAMALLQAAEIGSPRPAPYRRRFVEASTCVNGAKIRS